MQRTGLRPMADTSQSRPLRRATYSAWHLQRGQVNVAGNTSSSRSALAARSTRLAALGHACVFLPVGRPRLGMVGRRWQACRGYHPGKAVHGVEASVDVNLVATSSRTRLRSSAKLLTKMRQARSVLSRSTVPTLLRMGSVPRGVPDSLDVNLAFNHLVHRNIRPRSEDKLTRIVRRALSSHIGRPRGSSSNRGWRR